MNPLLPRARTIAYVLIGVPLAAWGCSSILGYGDVGFGETPDDSDASAGGTGGSAGNPGQGGSLTDAKADTKTGAGGSDSSAGGSPAGGNAGSPAGGSGGSQDPCASVTCGANQHCEPATKTCVCNPGYVSSGSDCTPAAPGDPSTHTEQDVCDHWKSGHALTDQSPWTAGATECDPGTLSQGGITDTLTRIAMYRWMVGLGPVSDDASLDDMDQYCAVCSSWNPPGTVPNPHNPPTTAKCYTSQGAQGAGQSNIAWGSGHPAQAIDQFVEDNGNETTMGHRRWIFNPPLGPVGIGYYAGGGPYGNAECLAVFGQSGGGPSPTWISFPPPGFSPIDIVGWMWTFHHTSDTTNASIKVTRTSDSADLAMTKMPLIAGYANYSTVGFQPNGWSPKAGDIYVVEISGVGSGAITYEVKPVACN